MKRRDPCAEEPLTISSDDSDSDSKHSIDGATRWIKTRDQPAEDSSPEAIVIKTKMVGEGFSPSLPYPPAFCKQWKMKKFPTSDGPNFSLSPLAFVCIIINGSHHFTLSTFIAIYLIAIVHLHCWPCCRRHHSQGALLRRAKMYQEFMNSIPVPVQRSSVIPCTSWYGLGSSMKRLYCQPLHYLTNVLLKQRDQMRIGSDDEHEPLDVIIHPSKAEAEIWVAEEVHRLTASHHHLAKLWTLDPLYHTFIDPVIPNL